MTNRAYKVKYGLPAQVMYCKLCVMSNQKPNTSVEYLNSDADRTYIGFDAEQICAACQYNVVKFQTNWETREIRLLEVLERYRKSDGSFDVIVPASGGKDSIYAAHLLKHKYGMHPLTVTWAPHIYRKVGWNNMQKMIHAGGLTNLLYTPNGNVHRQLTQLAFKNQLHPFQPFVYGQKNLGPLMSIAFNIPLVMYGESNLEYGDPTGSDEEEMTEQRFAMKHDYDQIKLAGVSANDLLQNHRLTKNDLQPYFPIEPELIRKVGTSVRYLGHYIKWDPQECYYYAVEHVGFEAAEERSEGTYTKHTELDDKLVPLNFYAMHCKFGIGRAMYDAAQEIRNGKITREEGVRLVQKFDGEYPSLYFEESLEYLNMSRLEFDATCDSFRSEHLWKLQGNAQVLRHPIE